jgi:CheY-like chemotaxis protein
VVLVVDDDPQVQHMAERLLTSDGYNVVTAPNGKDGLARLLEVWPDVIVLDLDMPVMDGWQFRAEQQRLANERLAAIPVILVTAEDHAVHHAARLRAVGVLKKPFDTERLLHVIRGALRGAESPQLPR